MKTIRELRDEGLMNTRLYHGIMRNAADDLNYQLGYHSWVECRTKGVCNDEIQNLTIEDLFDIFGEEHMLRYWRNVGSKWIEELKGLI